MADIFRDRLLTNSQIHFTYGASSWDEIDGILVPWGPFLFSEWTEQYFRSFCPGIRFVQSTDGIAFFWEGFPFNGNKPNCALWRTDILTNVALNFAKKKNKKKDWFDVNSVRRNPLAWNIIQRPENLTKLDAVIRSPSPEASISDILSLRDNPPDSLIFRVDLILEWLSEHLWNTHSSKQQKKSNGN